MGLGIRRDQWTERKLLKGALGFVFLLGLLYIGRMLVHFEAYLQGLINAASIRDTTDVSGSKQTLAMLACSSSFSVSNTADYFVCFAIRAS